MSRPAKPTRAELRLKQEADHWKTTAALLRTELTNKETYTGRLEFLLHKRAEKIDDLNGKLEQLRDQNRRLDVENDRLVAMMQLAPQS